MNGLIWRVVWIALVVLAWWAVYAMLDHWEPVSYHSALGAFWGPGNEFPPGEGKIHLRGFRDSRQSVNLRRQVFPTQAGIHSPAPKTA